MRPPTLQLESVIEAFGRQGWHCEPVEGRQVVRAQFEAHHARVELHAQVFPELNALAVFAEAPFAPDTGHLPAVLELLMRANKQLTLGAFEFDFDRRQLVFRITNLFERERYDADIVSSMVHCAIAEIDRLTPLLATVLKTAPDLLEDLSLPVLLEREDLLPPVPEGTEEEEL